MQDFNKYSQSNKSENVSENIFDTVNNIAKKFDGKSQNELLRAIYSEAERGKRNGTLTNAQIDEFANMLAPALDEKQKRILKKLVEKLKTV